MLQKSVIGLVLILAAGIQLKAEQDFERSYDFAPFREILIDNRLGDFKVTGYDGKEIKISASKRGSDKDSVEIVEKSFGHRIHISPEYPKFKKIETSVHFEVKVPNSMNLVPLKVIAKTQSRNIKVPTPKQPVLFKLVMKSKSGGIEITDINCFLEAHSESGDIEVKDSRGILEARSGSGDIDIVDYKGDLRAHSYRGNIKLVNVDGHVDARSQSGDMKAEIKQAQSNNQWKFSSISGDITVTAPKDLSAIVEMSSSGNLKSDFALDRSKRRYGENTAHGRLGSGGMRMIVMSSVSGSVSLMKE
jgi:DUF4097 and DUF4098 domain-containing protein YvlB